MTDELDNLDALSKADLADLCAAAEARRTKAVARLVDLENELRALRGPDAEQQAVTICVNAILAASGTTKPAHWTTSASERWIDGPLAARIVAQVQIACGLPSPQDLSAEAQARADALESELDGLRQRLRAVAESWG